MDVFFLAETDHGQSLHIGSWTIFLLLFFGKLRVEVTGKFMSKVSELVLKGNLLV